MRGLWAVMCLLVVAGRVDALDYPTRQVTIVVPVAAGGAVDFLGRMIASRLSEQLGQTFIVENRTGAGMVTGTVSVARAPADGYTLMMGTSSSHAINASLHKTLAYDPARDFIPVAYFAGSPFTLGVYPALPIRDVTDLVAYAKQHQLTYASAGPGSPQHLFAELLKSEAHIDIAHVPYRGNIPAITDVVAGHVSLMFSDPSGLSVLREGKLRPLGVTSATRVAALPDVPPLAEAGMPGLDAVAWLMLFAPAATPRSIVELLNAEIKTYSLLPETKAKIEQNAQIAIVTPPVDELQRFVRAEMARWGNVVEHAGIAGSQ